MQLFYEKAFILVSLVRVVERIVVEVNQDEGHGIVAGVSSC